MPSDYLPTRISAPPVPHEITLGYLAFWADVYYPGRPHLGVDFGSPKFTPFYSWYLNPTRAHAVHRVGDGWGDGSFGNMLVLDVGYLPDNKTKFYAGFAHCEAIYVEVGEIIPPGMLLGLTGDSGFAKGAHLHLQHSVDPNFSRDAETEDPLSGLNLVVLEPPEPPKLEYASPHDLARLNYAITLRNAGHTIFNDPDLSRVEQAAAALRAAGFKI